MTTSRGIETDPIEPAEAERVTPNAAFPSPFFDPDASVPLAKSLPHERRGATASHSPVRARFVRSFRDASWPRRLTVLLLPVVIGLYALKAVRARNSTRAHPAASRKAVQSAPRPRAASVISPTELVAPTGQLPSGVAGESVLLLQRQAVDAFASGNFRDAAALYRRLAMENPTEPAFAVAARVATEKANGVGHD